MEIRQLDFIPVHESNGANASRCQVCRSWGAQASYANDQDSCFLEGQLTYSEDRQTSYGAIKLT